MSILLLKCVKNNLDYDITDETKDMKNLFIELALESKSFRDVLEESANQVKFIFKLRDAIEAEDTLHQAKSLITTKK